MPPRVVVQTATHGRDQTNKTNNKNGKWQHGIKIDDTSDNEDVLHDEDRGPAVDNDADKDGDDDASDDDESKAFMPPPVA
jgi:hypothetical protein